RSPDRQELAPRGDLLLELSTNGSRPDLIPTWIPERASQLALCVAATARRISATPPASCAVLKAGASSRTAYAGARRVALGGVPREAFRLRQLEKFPFSGTIF